MLIKNSTKEAHSASRVFYFTLFFEPNMQRMKLFDTETNNQTIVNGNITIEISALDSENNFSCHLVMPSGSFILNLEYIGNKIRTFELVDFSEYMFITVSIIKNLKKLIEAILIRNNFQVC